MPDTRSTPPPTVYLWEARLVSVVRRVLRLIKLFLVPVRVSILGGPARVLPPMVASCSPHSGRYLCTAKWIGYAEIVERNGNV